MDPLSSKTSTAPEAVKLATDKPVLVTGAGGWIGSHCVYQLLDRGYRVRGTVRDLAGEKYQFLKSIHPAAKDKLELVQADLLSSEGWNEAVEGVEYILHIASPFTYSFKHEDDLIKPAVQGTEVVYNAALHHCDTVKRIVHTSSVVAVVYGHPSARYAACPVADSKKKDKSLRKSATCVKEDNDKKLFDESEWSVVENISGYEKSKTLSEMKAWEMIKAHNDKSQVGNKVELTVINPTFVFGPLLARCHNSTESTTHILRIMNRVYPLVPDMESEHVDVRDVALAHIRGMELPSEKVAFRRFLLADSGGRLHFSEQSKILASAFNKYGFTPATTTAPQFLFSMGKYFSADVRAACDKLGKNVGVSTAAAASNLGMTKWRSTSDALYAHVITLMKFGLLEKQQTPQEEIDSYLPYPGMATGSKITTSSTEAGESTEGQEIGEN